MNEPLPDALVLVSTIYKRPRHQPPCSTAMRPSRLARTLALAHHLQRAIDLGAIDNRAAIARAFGLSRVRVTQILDLLHLAPDLQEFVLGSRTVNGKEPLREREVRKISDFADWTGQRALFVRLFAAARCYAAAHGNTSWSTAAAGAAASWATFRPPACSDPAGVTAATPHSSNPTAEKSSSFA